MAAAEPAAPAMKVVEVDLGDRTYPIYIGRGLLDQGELLRKHIPGKTALIVTNETIAPLYLDRRGSARPSCGTRTLASVVLHTISPIILPANAHLRWYQRANPALPLPLLLTACRCIQAVTGDGRVKAEVVTLPDGEQHKNLEVLQKVWDKALECR